MFYFNSCPKCKIGTSVLEEDQLRCLNCGVLLYLTTQTNLGYNKGREVNNVEQGKRSEGWHSGGRKV